MRDQVLSFRLTYKTTSKRQKSFFPAILLILVFFGPNSSKCCLWKGSKFRTPALGEDGIKGDSSLELLWTLCGCLQVILAL
ncbi:hypothetical protein CEXT_582921 [Caerostris extrusa]|uniref:Uncharacterized protein n=1 Tax=Caerostris extrusa TaxID=172846 RepID=A0AAV4RPG7_CAEEX|nr:hypothetical protein CEXT_582921 [Caerostris extrusa]